MKLKIIFNLIFIFYFALSISSIAQQKTKKGKPKSSPSFFQQKAENYFIEAEKQFILKNHSKSIINLKKSLRNSPENDVIFYKLAQVYIANNQVDSAELSILKALYFNKKNYYYYTLAADIYLKTNNVEKAIFVYEELINNIPNNKHFFFKIGNLYLYSKEYEEAINAYQQAEEYFGINEQSSLQKQKIYLKQNRLKKALQEGQNLVNSYPNNVDYTLMLAKVLSKNGSIQEAILLIEEMEKKLVDTPNSQLFLANLYYKVESYDKFEAKLDSIFLDEEIPVGLKVNTVMTYIALLPNKRLELLLPSLCEKLTYVHPNDYIVYLLQGDVYSHFLENQLIDSTKIKIYTNKVIEAYTKYIHFDKSKFSVWKSLLNLELQQARYDSIILHGQLALEVFPNQIWLYLINGLAFSSNEKWDTSIFYFEEGVKRSANNKKMLELFYIYLGDSYNSVGKYKQSDESYDKALEINPNNELILNNYSYYLSLREQHLDKAHKMSSKLVELNSEELAYWDTYAWVQYKRKNYNEAQRVFKKIVLSNKATAVNFDHYGDVLLKLGKKKEARVQWMRAKALDKNINTLNKKIEASKISK